MKKFGKVVIGVCFVFFDFLAVLLFFHIEDYFLFPLLLILPQLLVVFGFRFKNKVLIGIGFALTGIIVIFLLISIFNERNFPFTLVHFGIFLWLATIVFTIVLAVEKGYNGFLAFLLGLFIPLLGSTLVIALLPDKNENAQTKDTPNDTPKPTQVRLLKTGQNNFFSRFFG
jgi:hypothetical protein